MRGTQTHARKIPHTNAIPAPLQNQGWRGPSARKTRTAPQARPTASCSSHGPRNTGQAEPGQDSSRAPHPHQPCKGSIGARGPAGPSASPSQPEPKWPEPNIHGTPQIRSTHTHTEYRTHARHTNICTEHTAHTRNPAHMEHTHTRNTE